MPALSSSLFYLTIIFIFSFTLIKSVAYLINSSSKIARHLGISEYTIGLLLIAVSTSLPEVMVGINSALDKKPLLSFGNVLGANIALLTLIPAISILVGQTIRTRSIIKSKDIYFAGSYAVLPLLLAIDGTLSRIDGAILLTAFLIFVRNAMSKSKGIESIISHFERTNIWKQLLVFSISVSVILLSGNFIVHYAEKMSESLGIGLAFIGLTVTALGTSLPETTFSIEAAMKKKQGEILGDILGSIITNSTLVLGISSFIHPIGISESRSGPIAIVFMVLALAVFYRAVQTDERMDKWEAGILLATYLIFIAGEYIFATY